MNAFGSALPGYQDRPKHHLVIVGELEFEFGWVFYFNTKEFVDTGDLDHALGGNAPLIFDRADGELYFAGTAHDLDSYIEEYRNGKRRPAEPGRGWQASGLSPFCHDFP